MKDTDTVTLTVEQITKLMKTGFECGYECQSVKRADLPEAWKASALFGQIPQLLTLMDKGKSA